MHLDCKSVLAGFNIIGNIKSVRTERILAVTDLFSVQVDIVRRLHAVKFYIYAASARLHRTVNSKCLAVKSYWVVIRRSFGTGNVIVVSVLPRFADIAVYREIKALRRPAVRQLDRLPAVLRRSKVTVRDPAVVEVLLRLFGVLNHLQIPFAALSREHLHIFRLLTRIVVPDSTDCGVNVLIRD